MGVAATLVARSTDAAAPMALVVAWLRWCIAIPLPLPLPEATFVPAGHKLLSGGGFPSIALPIR
jgi:hypothetical protein